MFLGTENNAGSRALDETQSPARDKPLPGAIGPHRQTRLIWRGPVNLV